MPKFGRIYPHYKFKDHDPILDSVDTLVEQYGAKRSIVAAESGVSTTTLSNWARRKTKRPQYATVAAVINALGGAIEVRIPRAKAAAKAKR